MLLGEVNSVWRQAKDAGLAQGEPPGGVEQGGLASQLIWLQSFGLICVGRLWVIGRGKASVQNRGPDPEDQGGDGVPRKGHRGEGLQEIQVQKEAFVAADGDFIE